MTSRTEKEVTFSLLNSSGRARLTLMGVLACSLLVFGFILLLQNPAQAFPTKAGSCLSNGCHKTANSTDAGITMSIALNGSDKTSSPAVTVAAGKSFEVDYSFTGLTDATYKNVGVQIAVPTGWTVAVGTSNSPTLTGWKVAWDAADGVGWNKFTASDTGYTGAPAVYHTDYSASSWHASRGGAWNSGLATTSDLDQVADLMGTDASVTVPSGASPGTYSVWVAGVGHDTGGKAHYKQVITVTVVNADSTAPTITAFTATSPTNSLNIPITAFTASDAGTITGYQISTSATAPSAFSGGWSATAPTTHTVAGIGAYTLYAWVKDAGNNVSSSATQTVNVTPTVTSTSPNSLNQGATGNVIITGANFTNTGLSSSFGTGITVNSTTYNSATQVTANINVNGAA